MKDLIITIAKRQFYKNLKINKVVQNVIRFVLTISISVAIIKAIDYICF